ncbi:TetR/AcrR family transcriptional regulator [Streptomyces canus]|uniref:TetR/AcrR family transcriptional regulator n=1 Tax=Streptomyces canus TaxID=58343 RepID=UPI00352CAC1E
MPSLPEVEARRPQGATSAVDRLVEAGRDVLSRKGYNTATVDDIAERAGQCTGQLLQILPAQGMRLSSSSWTAP